MLRRAAVPDLLAPKNLDLFTPVADLGWSFAWLPNGRIVWGLALEYVSEMAVLVSSRPDICDTACGHPSEHHNVGIGAS